jgi:hypothetical protein
MYCAKAAYRTGGTYTALNVVFYMAPPTTFSTGTCNTIRDVITLSNQQQVPIPYVPRLQQVVLADGTITINQPALPLAMSITSQPTLIATTIMLK